MRTLDGPTDRAVLTAAMPFYDGCTGRHHKTPCPGSLGLADDLPRTPEPTGPVGSTATPAGAQP